MSALPPRHQNLILWSTILASSLAFVDGSVVNVGLPAIARSLGADAASLGVRLARTLGAELELRVVLARSR